MLVITERSRLISRDTFRDIVEDRNSKTNYYQRVTLDPKQVHPCCAREEYSARSDASIYSCSGKLFADLTL